VTTEETVQYLREEVFRLMDRTDLLWRIASRGMDFDEREKYEEFFRYHCGMEAQFNQNWISANLPGLTEDDRAKVMRERMTPRLPTPREELLETLARALLDPSSPGDRITSLAKAAGL
jgi:hypothetical protein